jgi:hypothetical protein
MANESLILNPNSRQVGSMLGYKPVPQETNSNAVLPVEMPFSRASGGYEKRSDGLWYHVGVNVPRRYWDGTKYSWLFQKELTNLFQNSEPATTPAGSTTVAVSFAANDWGIGLDGKVILQDNSTLRLFYNTSGLPTSGVATMAAIVKRTDLGEPVERNEGPAIGSTDFFLTLNNPGTVISVTKQNLGNGLWFFAKKVTLTGGSGGVGILKDISQRNTTIEVSAIMVCVGNHDLSPLDYIKTTGSTVTRLEDISLTSNLNNNIGQTEGTILFEGTAYSNTEIFKITKTGGGGVATDSISFIHTGGNAVVYVYANNVNVVYGTFAQTKGQRFKIALCYKNGEAKIYLNGVLVQSTTPTIVFTEILNQLNLRSGGFYFAIPGSFTANEIKFFDTFQTNGVELTTL